MQRGREAAGLPPSVTLYRLRHAFGCQAIRKGIHMKIVSTVMGHATTQMVDRWYSDISDDKELLLDAVGKMCSVYSATAGGESTPRHKPGRFCRLKN
jgi:integrase